MKQIRGKRIISLILSVVMVVCLPQVTYATESTTTENNANNAILSANETEINDVSILNGEEVTTGRTDPKNPTYNEATDTATYDCVYFGSYPQTEVKDSALTSAIINASYTANNDYTATVNGVKYRRLDKTMVTYGYDGFNNGYKYFKYESIKWRVLQNDGTNLLLLAETALDDKKYNDTLNAITWENCTLRSYLNKEFLNRAFSNNEQNAIQKSTVLNENNPWYGTAGGNNTTDKIYLLSSKDMVEKKYGFTTDDSKHSTSRRSKSTDYAKAMGAWKHVATGNCWWWLRSPGNTTNSALSVDTNGFVRRYGDSVHNYREAVRPALSLPLSSNLWSNASNSGNGGQNTDGDFSLQLDGESIDVTIPNSVPFLNGQTISMGLPSDFPATLYYAKSDKHKLRITINTEEEDSTIDDEEWNKLKKSYGILKNVKDTKKQKELLKSMTAGAKGSKMLFGDNVEVNAAGYLEAELDNAGAFKSITGNVNLYISYEDTKSFQNMIYVVPVTLNLSWGLNGNITLTGTIKSDQKKFKYMTDLIFEPNANLQISAGTGVGTVAMVGGYVRGDVDATYVVPGGYSQYTKSGLTKLEAKLAGGLIAYLLGKEYPYPLKESAPYDILALIKENGTGSSESSIDLYDVSNYQAAGRDYLSGQSKWLGSTEEILANSGEEISVGEAADSLNVLYPLLTNTYGASTPKLISNGTDTVLVFTTDAEDRDKYNYSCLMYSVWDATNKSWSLPLKLDSNNTADYYPSLFEYNNDIYLCYADESKTFTDQSTLKDMAGALDIACAKFDSSTKKFGTPTRLIGGEPATGSALGLEMDSSDENILAEDLEGGVSENKISENSASENEVSENAAVVSGYDGEEMTGTQDSAYDTMPCMTVVNGKVAVVWTSNSNTDVFGRNMTNSIKYSTLETTGWSEPQILKSGLNSITELKAESGEAIYIVDGDNNLATSNDHTLYTQKIGGTTLTTVSSGSIWNVTTGTVGTTEHCVAWIDNNSLKYKPISTSTISSLVSENCAASPVRYQLCGNSLVMTLADAEGQNNLYLSKFDSTAGVFGNPVRMTSQEKCIYDFSADQVDGHLMTILMQGDFSTENGTKNLAFTYLDSTHDLKVSGADYDFDSVSSGNALPINVEVENRGSSDVTKVDVKICDSNGTIVGSEIEKAVSIGVGDSISLETSFTLPATLTSQKYMISVTESGVKENITTNNSAEFTLGETDVSLSATKVSGNETGADIVVKNEGKFAASNIIVSAYINDSETPVETKTIDSLTASQAKSLKFTFGEWAFDTGETEGTITYRLTSGAQDIYDYNNASTLYYNRDHKITFDSQGSTEIESQTVSYGNTITLPVVTKAGYLLGGWYTKPFGRGIQYTENTRIREDATLYAYWIKSEEASKISDATVKAIAKQTYTGDAITPALTVQYRKVTLKAGTDYTVTYQDNKNVGTAKAVIYGIGNYIGTKNVEFTIIPKKIAKTAIEVYDATATGKAITPTVIIMDGTKKLEQETDYQILNIKNNTKPGKASMTISGNGNYAGSTINKKFLIYKAGILPISSTEISFADGQVPKEGFTYSGKAYKPKVVLMDLSGNTIDKKNYTVRYKNNKNAGTASVIVKGKGKVYKGSKTLYFTIQPKSIVKVYSIGKITDKKFTGGLITPKATISLNGTKKKLVNKKEYSLSYENNLVAGTATVLVTGKGNYTGSLMSTFQIQATPLGRGFSVKGLKTQKYTGSEIKPTISLIYKNQTLVKERDYTVSYQNNVEIGKATVTIQAVEGSGLTGSMTKTFKIKK